MIKKRNIKRALKWMRQFINWLRRLYKWVFECWPFIIAFGIGVIHYLVLSSLKDYGYTNIENQINSWISFSAQFIGLGFILCSIDSNLRLFNQNSVINKVKKWWERRPKFRPELITIDVDSGRALATGGMVGVRSVSNFKNMDIDEKLEYLKQEIEILRKESKKQNKEIRQDFNEKTKNLNKKIGKLETKIKDTGSKLEEISIGGLDQQIFGVLVAVYGLFVDSFL